LYAHAEHLSHTFDLHSVVVDTLYKKDFDVLCGSISGYIERSNSPHLLIGESFGAAVALSVYQNLKRRKRSKSLNTNQNQASLVTALALVNSVTAFEASQWPDKMDEIISDWTFCRIVKLIAEHGPSAYEILELARKLATSHGAHAEVHCAMLINMSTMPGDVIQHRVTSWVGDASKAALLEDVEVPVLIIAGKRDLFLPSEQEAHRLKSLIPRGQIRLLDCGHMITDQLEPIIVPWFRTL